MNGNRGALTGIVDNIQRYTIHDGPGIRTEVFLKGCPLKCKWCSNPESIRPKQEIGITASKCVGAKECGRCLKACPMGENTPLIVEENKVVAVDRGRCTECFACTKECYIKAVRIWGDRMTVEEVMKPVRADRQFYAKSGGGVTLNGGEVTVQWEFAIELLKTCKRENIHTCVETCLYCKPEIIEKFYPYTDLMITDIKMMDAEKHRYYTTKSNELILSNIKKTVEAGIPLVIRTPIVPGINDDDENMCAMAGFISGELHNRVVQVQLLPYMKLGTEKYKSLGIPYPLGEDFKTPQRPVYEARIQELRAILRAHGIPASMGANDKLELKGR